MKELIIVAGKNKDEVCWLRRCLREKGYGSIPCKSAEQITLEMEILPTCDAMVSLVIIDSGILSEIGEDSIDKLSDLSLDVPFLLASEVTQAGSQEVFEKICEYRVLFKRQQNPDLADILKENGVKIVCG